MTIKRIQLRGISSKPSDRSNSDGGCSESLNVQIEQGEISPVPSPVDLTSDPQSMTKYGLPPASAGEVYDVIYIHKGNDYRNFICQQGNSIGIWKSIPRKNLFFTDNEGQLNYSLVAANHDDVLGCITSALEEHGYPLSQSEINNIDHSLEEMEAGHNPSILLHIVDEEDVEPIEDSITEALADLEVGDFNNDYNNTDASARLAIDPFFALDSGESINSATSIGNTLVFATSSKTRYCIYKNGEYIYLGTEVPLPKVYLEMCEEPAYYNSDGLTAPWATNPSAYAQDATYYPKVVLEQEASAVTSTTVLDIIRSLDSLYEGGSEATPSSKVAQVLAGISDAIVQIDADAERLGIFTYPVWASCGIKLYDGSTRCCTPVLLGAGIEKPYRIILAQTEGSKDNIVCHVQRTNAYKIYIKIAEKPSNIELWKDIITSFDIYTSEPIGGGLYASGFAHNPTTSGSIRQTYICDVVMGKNDYSYEKELEDKSLLYLQKRFDIGQFDNLQTNQYIKIESNGRTRSANIVVQEKLEDPTFAHYGYVFDAIKSINNRIIGTGIKCSNTYDDWMFTAKANVTMYTGANYYFYCGVNPTRRYSYAGRSYYPSASVCEFVMDETIVDANKEIVCVNSLLRDIKVMSSISIDSRNHKQIAYGLFLLPEQKAESLRVLQYHSQSPTTLEGGNDFSTRPFGAYSLSFHNGGSETPLSSLIAGSKQPKTQSTDVFTSKENYLFVSEVDSPFSFPTSGRIRMSSRILDVASVSTPLSQGQFGAFPLYVFTSEGIWALKSTDIGTYSSSSLVSRDVLLDGHEVAPVDQAVIFATQAGVMCVSGSQITNLSENMIGKRFIIDNSTKSAILSHANWANLVPVICDETPFMTFMGSAKAMYDYAGGRLIFVSAEPKTTGYGVKYNYQYVYNIKTQTWHKLLQHTEASQYMKRPLNSFPDAYAQVNDYSVSSQQTGTHVFNYSTLLDTTSSVAGTGIIITRSLDFDEPDIRKSLNQLRIRGDYNSLEDIMYILFGSMDGVNWERLTTLRGGSYKYFRVMLLSSLQPTERISYLECDVEPRLTNRLR